MKKFTILAGLGLLAVSGLALAQPAEGPRGERGADLDRQQLIERTLQRFDRLDLDDDGRLTAEEARQARAQRRARRAERAFDRLDLDRNGNLTRAEFEQARAQLRERRSERRAERGERRGGRFMRNAHRAHAMRAGRLFGEQGFITREQFQERALTRFDRQDVNRDGTVTVAERRQAFEQRRERRQERRDRRD